MHNGRGETMNLTKTSICVDGELLKQAKKLKINISMITRDALYEAVTAAEKKLLQAELADAYSSDAQAHKEISKEFKYADQTW